jgi:PhnB protein
MAIKGASGEKGRITPHLIVKDANAAVDFYRRALGATELYRSPLPGGMGVHVHLRIGHTMVMVTEEVPPRPDEAELHKHVVLKSPQTLGGTCVVLELVVDDVDDAYRRAVDAGALPTLPLTDQFFGDRYGWVTDPFGHIWALATIKEELTPEEIERRLADMAARQR